MANQVTGIGSLTHPCALILYFSFREGLERSKEHRIKMLLGGLLKRRSVARQSNLLLRSFMSIPRETTRPAASGSPLMPAANLMLARSGVSVRPPTDTDLPLRNYRAARVLSCCSRVPR